MGIRRGRALSTMAALAAGAVTASVLALAGAVSAQAAEKPAEEPVFSRTLKVGDQGDNVGSLQRRLEWIGYDIDRSELRAHEFGRTTRKAVFAFQEKFFLSESGTATPRTRSKLLKVTSPLEKLPTQCRTGRVICIDTYQKLLRDVVDGKVRTVLDARFGFDEARTRLGMFSVYWKNRDQWSSAFDTPMPFSLFFSGGQAIHYSKYFKKDGYYGASHGCVNLRNYKEAERLFDRTPVGTPVFVYNSRT